MKIDVNQILDVFFFYPNTSHHWQTDFLDSTEMMF